jgi:tripartite-type tricarboxylate transporter receptor subunit TctC
VENRPGAVGVVAAEALMRAPPDGNTLMMGNTPDAIAAMIAADVALWAEAVKLAGVGEK